MPTPSWQDVAATAQEFRDASIGRIHPPVSDLPQDLPRNVTSMPKKVLTRDEVLITETVPEELVSSLASGELSSTAVVNAFLRRAVVAQKLVRSVQRPV